MPAWGTSMLSTESVHRRALSRGEQLEEDHNVPMITVTWEELRFSPSAGSPRPPVLTLSPCAFSPGARTWSEERAREQGQFQG